MPDFPAKEAREMRDIVVHDYDGVNDGRAWDTAIEDIPFLQTAAEKYLKTLHLRDSRLRDEIALE
jgi:uncharacterized protein with HEPN domain